MIGNRPNVQFQEFLNFWNWGTNWGLNKLHVITWAQIPIDMAQIEIKSKEVEVAKIH